MTKLTIGKVNEKIEKTRKQQIERNKPEEIISIIAKNDELSKKYQQQRKTKTFFI